MNVSALLGIAVLLAFIGFGIMGIGLLIAKMNSDNSNDSDSRD